MTNEAQMPNSLGVGGWRLVVSGDASKMRFGRDTGEMSGWLKHHFEHITRGTMPDLSFTRGDGVPGISTS